MRENLIALLIVLILAAFTIALWSMVIRKFRKKTLERAARRNIDLQKEADKIHEDDELKPDYAKGVSVCFVVWMIAGVGLFIPFLGIFIAFIGMFAGPILGYRAAMEAKLAKYLCPHCQRNIWIGKEKVDCKIECPACKKQILITNEGIKKPGAIEENTCIEETQPPTLVLDKNELKKVINVIYCTNCGIALPQQVNYCNNCGTNIMTTRIGASNKEECLIMEARGANAILQLFDTKLKIIKLPLFGKVHSEKEIPLYRIKSINFTECTLLQTGLIQFTIEGESGGFWQSAENAISWSFKGQNYQFKLINEAILQKKVLIK